MYLIALAAGLQRLEKNHEGETLVVPGLEWAIRKKKEGQIKSLPLFEVRSRRSVTKVYAGKTPAILAEALLSTACGHLSSCS
jgi:hypothetical protein